MAAPYAGASGGDATRQVKAQSERGLEAIALAKRKGVMGGQLKQLAADDRLHPESIPVVEWFAAEVTAAKSQHWLDELAALLPEAGIRRRRWWQGQPAATEAPSYDDDPDDGYEDDEDDQDADGEERITRAPSRRRQRPAHGR